MDSSNLLRSCMTDSSAAHAFNKVSFSTLLQAFLDDEIYDSRVYGATSLTAATGAGEHLNSSIPSNINR